jgi:multisubunit Na+/H+ antiporter MnhC subunit
MAAYSVCRKSTCATLVEGPATTCPKCGGPMRSVGESPIRGIILLVLGLILFIGMGVIFLNTYPTFSNPGVQVDGSRFTGTAEQGRQALMLFGVVIVFGLLAIVNGIYMLVTRQQSKVFIVLTLALAAILLVFTFVILGQAKQEEPVRTYRTY